MLMILIVKYPIINIRLSRSSRFWQIQLTYNNIPTITRLYRSILFSMGTQDISHLKHVENYENKVYNFGIGLIVFSIPYFQDDPSIIMQVISFSVIFVFGVIIAGIINGD